MKKIPMRQCIGCQEMKSKKEMIRVIKTPEDEICIDATGRKKRTRCLYLSEKVNVCRKPLRTEPGTFTEDADTEGSLRTVGRGDEEY